MAGSGGESGLAGAAEQLTTGDKVHRAGATIAVGHVGEVNAVVHKLDGVAVGERCQHSAVRDDGCFEDLFLTGGLHGHRCGAWRDVLDERSHPGSA